MKFRDRKDWDRKIRRGFVIIGFAVWIAYSLLGTYVIYDQFANVYEGQNILQYQIDDNTMFIGELMHKHVWLFNPKKEYRELRRKVLSWEAKLMEIEKAISLTASKHELKMKELMDFIVMNVKDITKFREDCQCGKHSQ